MKVLVAAMPYVLCGLALFYLLGKMKHRYIAAGISVLYGFLIYLLPKSISYVLLGVTLIFFTVHLICDLVMLFMRFTLLRGKERANLRKTAGVFKRGLAMALSVAFTISGAYNFSNSKITTYDFSTTDDTIKFVMVSDLHLGSRIGVERMKTMVAEINALNPDAVFIAGDIFDGNYDEVEDPEEVTEVLKGIKAGHGVFACWGNHDSGSDFGKMQNLVQNSGITVPENDAFIEDGYFTVISRPDGAEETGFAISSEEELSHPVIVLDHRPSRLEEDSAAGADFIFCGHTHNGQFFPANLVVKAINENPYGYSEKNNAKVIVSSGYGGFGPPFRVGSQSEIVEIILDRPDS